jgi:hypothetical protein
MAMTAIATINSNISGSVGLRPSLLMLGRIDASIVLLSLNRSVRLI